ncbi:MAG: hypothetical protein ACJAUU_000251 [Rickettsiales bacterium]|jgi:hypothetical protein
MNSFLSKIVLIIIIGIFSSCSSQKGIDLTFYTKPEGAKIYIDGVYRGETTKQVNLTPNKDYHLKLVKNGYKTIESEIKTKFSFRPSKTIKRIKCRLNLIGSVLILPIFLLKKNCVDFTETVYQFNMERFSGQNLQQNSWRSNQNRNQENIPYQNDQYQRVLNDEGRPMGSQYQNSYYQENQNQESQFQQNYQTQPIRQNPYQEDRRVSPIQENQYQQKPHQADNQGQYRQIQQKSYQDNDQQQPIEENKYQPILNPRAKYNTRTEDLNRSSQINSYYSSPYRYYDPNQIPKNNDGKRYQENEGDLNSYQGISQRNYLQIERGR